MNRNKLVMLALIIFCTYSIFSYADEKQTILFNQGKILNKVAMQTDVNNAKFITKEGVPYLDIQNVGTVFHPAWTGLYALQYANSESYYPKEVAPNEKLFFHLVKVLEEKLTYLNKNSAVWVYDFDNTYNNVYIKAPWYSSFAQAIGIEVFITAYEKTKDNKYLELAEKVATPLITPIEKNGLMYTKNDDVWFEEIPLKEESTHILNAHLRSLIALDLLYRNNGKKIYKEYFDKGLKTLQKWLPKYDAGYWLKYDLNPNYMKLFRITNPYGFETAELAIDNVSILDKNQNVLLKEDIGDGDDFDTNKSIFLSGIDWKSDYQDGNQTLREIKSSLPVDFKTEFENSNLVSPYTFLNVHFPKNENVFYLKITYKDTKKGNLVLQERTIAPSIKFQDLKNGIFLLKGDNTERSLIVKINESDLGFPVGLSYAWKHYLYLEKLAKLTNNKQIQKWSYIAQAHVHTIDYNTEKIVKNKKLILPQQTPMLPLLSFDNNMVIRQHKPSNKTIFVNGSYDFKSEGGIPVYSPFIVASQALNIPILAITDEKYEKVSKSYFKMYNFVTAENLKDIQKEPAINWLKVSGKSYVDSLVWKFDFQNSYNDVIQKAGWNSAFGQAYVIKAFLENGIYDYALKGANAYKYDISDGGVSSFDKSGNIWFEEVPNKTHILNAHLISQNVLMENLDKLNNKAIKQTTQEGLLSLKKYINDFDTGYWSKYDQNPKKELLFQLDWISGNQSPLISDICLISSVSHQKTCLDIGSVNDANGTDKVTGIDWSMPSVIDGKTVRSFQNGYEARTEAVDGGAIQNSFIWMSLPDRKLSDLWDITPYYLIIHYKDISSGQFVVKLQSMQEGDALEFVPLYGSNLITKGDHQWKDYIVPVRSNDLGWFLGVDYHKYHIVQMNDIVKKTDDVVLKQVAKRWQYYLEEYDNNQSVIIEPKKEFDEEYKNFEVDSNVKFYPGYGLDNAIDGNVNDNYVASLENLPMPHEIILDLKEKKFVDKIQLVWESQKNYASKFDVDAYENQELVMQQSVSNNKSDSEIRINKKVTKIVIRVRQYNGQQRLLMRAIKILTNR
ncbi:D-glucuronyl C5-epimerase family protein [Sulfurospirillum oryzae]|uniref:D-glucuronyl C5-epimerase family protein n=1 Tax=Sulfurospirillum oryzae TaxID=2976535 RepID=UPI0021E7AE4A|nr:D-glucuronyl C5-epimerase family protein [Sulfurospirillum oryzae]